MGNRTAKFISALVGSIIAGTPLAAVSQNAPTPSSAVSAASDCLTAPKGAAPQGQHWYYRLERTTKRQCWYLRAAGDKDSVKTAQTAQTTSDTPTTDAPAPQQHAPQDARAEYLTPRSGAAAQKTPNAPAQAAAPTPVQQAAEQTADGNAQQPAAATPWPDVSAASAPPAPPAPTVVAAPAQPGAKPSKSPSPVALAAADGTADKPTGSLQTLLLVIGGALALAGMLGSVIYRFAGARVRRQSADRHGHWGDREMQDQDGGRAPWLPSAPADTQPLHPIDFDAVRPQPKKQTTKLAAIGREMELIDARRQRAATPAEPIGIRRDKVETKAVDKKIESVATAPRRAANEIGENRDDAPAGRDADAVDIEVITTMLEQLAKEGPRLSRPNLEADLANFARSLRGQSAARA
ncbi:hypothetical protein ABIG06_005820 [Bradyrhizobium sp. USDA 326]|uniref:hypothetical protein n=1 Tax=unclassified Bradyrhizobium TaxID=2631580 RepID=UPI0035160FFF